MILVIKVNVIQENIRSVDLKDIKLMVYNKSIGPGGLMGKKGECMQPMLLLPYLLTVDSSLLTNSSNSSKPPQIEVL
jgi:hypothetical protein